MVTYSKTTWVNDQAPAINDTNLNNIESGVENLYHEFNANSILKADSDNTPINLTVAGSTFLGRKAAGNIAAMSIAEAKTLLAIVVADISDHDKAAHDALGIAPASHGADKHTNRTREIFLSVGRCYSTIALDDKGNHAIIALPDAALSYMRFSQRLPIDFVELTDIKIVFISPNATGTTVVFNTNIQGANDGESYTTNIVSCGDVSVVMDEGDKIQKESVKGVADFSVLDKNDILGIRIYRKGTDGSDNYEGIINFIGLIIEYTADQ